MMNLVRCLFGVCGVPAYDDEDLMTTVSDGTVGQGYVGVPVCFEKNAIINMVTFIDCRFYGRERPLVLRGVLSIGDIRHIIIIDGYCIHRHSIDEHRARILASTLVCQGMKYSVVSRPWDPNDEPYDLYVRRMRDKKIEFVRGYHDVFILL